MIRLLIIKINELVCPLKATPFSSFQHIHFTMNIAEALWESHSIGILNLVQKSFTMKISYL